jgi:hypothetical protein
VTLYTRESREMHEMVEWQSRFGATINQPKSAGFTQAKGTLRQIKVN